MAFLGLARAGLATRFELFADEALYAWVWDRLPFSFSPHPPGTPLLGGLGMQLLGRGEIGLRILSLVLSTAAPVPLWALAARIGGWNFAAWAVLAFSLVPMYLGFGVILTPDAAQLFFWCSTLLTVHAALESGRMRYWVATGVLLGVVLFFKYVSILFLPALLIAMLMHGPWRRQLTQPGAWACLLAAAAVFGPAALYAESRTGWELFQYHLRDRQDFVTPTPKSLGVYHGAHLLYVSPVFYVACVAAMVWTFRQGLRGRGDCAFLFAFTAVPWLFFSGVALVTKRILSREQWDAVAYAAGIVAVVLMAREMMAHAAPGRAVQFRRLAGVGLVLAALTTAGIVIEGMTGLISRVGGFKSLFANMLGHRAAAAAVDAHLETLPAEPRPFVLGNKFSDILLQQFYTTGQAPAYTLDNSSNHRFGIHALLRRGEATQDFLPSETGHNALFIMEDSRPDPSESGSRRIEKLRTMFESVEELEPLVVSTGGRAVKSYRFARCRGLLPRAP